MNRPRWYPRCQNNHNGLVQRRIIVRSISVCRLASSPQRKRVDFQYGSDMVAGSTIIVVVTVVTYQDGWTHCLLLSWALGSSNWLALRAMKARR